MAEPCIAAFGRYLRMLRERRRLSLDEVAAMSRALADPLGKAYLSRCENGKHGVGFSKMVTLSRIYEVPMEVLAERMELDLELDRVGGPETDGIEYAKLVAKGASAIHRGALWDAYGYFRDALPLAHRAEVSPTFTHSTEQLLVGWINLGTAAMKLGRARLALHELLYAESVGELTPRHQPLLLERLACAYRMLGEMQDAVRSSDEAIAAACAAPNGAYVGYAYGTRARIASDLGQRTDAIRLYQLSFREFRSSGHMGECAITLLNLASTYLDMKRVASARRAALAAERIAIGQEQSRVRILLRVLMGDIEEALRRPEEAVQYWRDALVMAKDLKDKILQFKAELPLYRNAIQNGEERNARAFERRLLRLEGWIPKDVAELHDFKALIAARHGSRPRRVAASQPTARPRRNQ